ncbi:hypothetical protein SODG_000855 [Sodalis praecaptivus]
MTNIAYADFGAQNERKELHVAELEEGYTKLANALLDALLRADITLHQQKVVLAIIRKTYGFNKKLDRITNTQIAEMTGIPATRVCTAKNRLLERKFLLMDGNCIGVNKVISEWQTLPEKGNTQNREYFPKKGNELFPKTGNPQKGKHSPKEGMKPSPKQGMTIPQKGETQKKLFKRKK